MHLSSLSDPRRIKRKKQHSTKKRSYARRWPASSREWVFKKSTNSCTGQYHNGRAEASGAFDSSAMCTSGYLQGERCTLWASLTSIPGRYCRGSCRIRWILIFVSQPLNKRFWSMEYRVFSIVIKVANLVRRNFFPCCKIMVFRSIWMEKIGRSIISIKPSTNGLDKKAQLRFAPDHGYRLRHRSNLWVPPSWVPEDTS